VGVPEGDESPPLTIPSKYCIYPMVEHLMQRQIFFNRETHWGGSLNQMFMEFCNHIQSMGNDLHLDMAAELFKLRMRELHVYWRDRKGDLKAISASGWYEKLLQTHKTRYHSSRGFYQSDMLYIGFHKKFKLEAPVRDTSKGAESRFSHKCDNFAHRMQEAGRDVSEYESYLKERCEASESLRFGWQLFISSNMLDSFLAQSPETSAAT
jgi:hypothetical protein